eukprot:1219767-Alexandrium_andersonii.AAC.1
MLAYSARAMPMCAHAPVRTRAGALWRMPTCLVLVIPELEPAMATGVHGSCFGKLLFGPGVMRNLM